MWWTEQRTKHLTNKIKKENISHQTERVLIWCGLFRQMIRILKGGWVSVFFHFLRNCCCCCVLLCFVVFCDDASWNTMRSLVFCHLILVCFALPGRPFYIFTVHHIKLSCIKRKERSSPIIKSAMAREPRWAARWHVSMGTEETEWDGKFGGISLKEKKNCTKRREEPEWAGHTAKCWGTW